MTAGPGDDSLEMERLRQDLASANDRLALYEGFDRVIEDQVRRTGEAMREIVELREQAAGGIAVSQRAGVEAGLVSISSEIARMSVSLEEISHQIDTLLAALRTASAGSTDVPEPLSSPADGSGTPEVGSSIDLIVHEVRDTAMALSMQRHLLGLDPVDSAEVREFAEGVLRLHLTLDAPLHASDFEGWGDPPGVRVVHQSPGVIELFVGVDAKSLMTGTNSHN